MSDADSVRSSQPEKTEKIFGPKTYCCQQLDRRVYEYVTETQTEAMSITRAVIQLTALEIIMQVNPLVDADFL